MATDPVFLDETTVVELIENARTDAVDETARETASKAYVAPVDGIPAGQLSSDVQAALTNPVDTAARQTAGAAFVKPTGGISTPDLASGVVASLGKADSAVQPAALTSGLAGKADASAVTTALAGKAPLVNGLIPNENIPALALTSVTVVASRAAMLALTPSQVQPGDVAADTSTGATRGSYMLAGTDPSDFANWVAFTTPTDVVASVAGKTGVVVLSAADVGLDKVTNVAPADLPISTAQAVVNLAKADIDPLTGKVKPGQLPATLGPQAALAFPNAVAVGLGPVGYILPFDQMIAGVTAYMDDGSNAATAFDLRLNEVSIFADQTKLPTVKAGRKKLLRQTVGVQGRAGDVLKGGVVRTGAAITPGVPTVTESTVNGGQIVTFPRPDGAAEGHYYVATISTTVGGANGGSLSQPPTVVVPPDGWTEIGLPQRASNNTGARDLEVHTFVGRDDGSTLNTDGTAKTFTFTVTTPTSVAYADGRLAKFIGISPSGTGVDAYAAITPGAGDNAPAAQSVTTTKANDLIYVAWVNAQTSATAAVPSDMTQAGTYTKRTISAYRTQAAAGLSATEALSTASAAATTHWVAITLALDTTQDAPGGKNATLVVDFSA